MKFYLNIYTVQIYHKNGWVFFLFLFRFRLPVPSCFSRITQCDTVMYIFCSPNLCCIYDVSSLCIVYIVSIEKERFGECRCSYLKIQFPINYLKSLPWYLLICIISISLEKEKQEKYPSHEHKVMRVCDHRVFPVFPPLIFGKNQKL